jgi:hypothetical protein
MPSLTIRLGMTMATATAISISISFFLSTQECVASTWRHVCFRSTKLGSVHSLKPRAQEGHQCDPPFRHICRPPITDKELTDKPNLLILWANHGKGTQLSTDHNTMSFSPHLSHFSHLPQFLRTIRIFASMYRRSKLPKTPGKIWMILGSLKETERRNQRNTPNLRSILINS